MADRQSSEEMSTFEGKNILFYENHVLPVYVTSSVLLPFKCGVANVVSL